MPNHRSDHRTAQRVEPLEARQLLSASLEDGVWHIRGDENRRNRNDVIVVEATSQDPAVLRALINGVEVGTTPLAGLSAVGVDGGKGNDRVTMGIGAGTAVSVSVQGGKGNDRLLGSTGAEQMLGGAGNDRIDGGGGNDELDGQGGNDSVLGGDGDDICRGGKGNDSIAGGSGRDALDGGRGRDRIKGGDDDDQLEGAGGDDRLAGGPGADLLSGGRGRDRILRDPANVDQVVVGRNGKIDRKDTLEDDDVTGPAPRSHNSTDLRQWVVDAAVKQWSWAFGQPTNPYQYYAGPGGTLLVARGDALTPSPSPQPSLPPVTGAPVSNNGGAAAEGGDSSGTNTQEDGVDEADLVETDGLYIYSLEDDELIIASAVPADAMRVVHRRAIGEQQAPLGLYRHGNRLTMLTGSFYYNILPLPPILVGDGRVAVGAPVAVDSIVPPERFEAKVTVRVLDVSDPAAPSVVEETTLDGSYDGSRMVGEKLYLVLRNDTFIPPPLPIPGPVPIPDPGPIPEPEPLPGGVGGGVVSPQGTTTDTVYESEAAYRARIAAMPLDDLLPEYSSDAAGQETGGLLVSPTDSYVRTLTDADVGQNLTTLALLDVGDTAGGPKATSTVAGFGGTVYASSESFYLASFNWTDGVEQTRLFKFALAPDAVPLVATGQVPGSVLNQFSMDEEGDHFRIATNRWDDGGNTDIVSEPVSGLYVLSQSGDELDVVGSVTDLARGERLQSARFVGDRAYIVTFRQIDPLFTIDLSDPAKPFVAGELKIPGFSSYLHPISADLLIGLGRDIDPVSNQDQGLQVSLFDVSNAANPRRVAAFKLSDKWEHSEAETDHHAFSYFPEHGVLALPVTRYDGVFHQDLAVLKVDASKGAGAFEKLGETETPSGVRRSLRIGEVLYAIGPEHIQAVSITAPETGLGLLATGA